MGEAYQVSDQYATYFLTFQVVGWADVFSRKEYRDIVLDSFSYCRTNKHLLVHAYVIMTNHIHCILSSENGSLSSTIRDLKKYIARQIINSIRESNSESRKEWLLLVFEYHAKYNKRADKYQLWTHENHAVELSSNSMIESRLEYIHLNPVEAGWVECPEDYLYSSARNYMDDCGLIEIDLID
jgi:REP element-mobilizing transposase RayT